MAGNQPKSTSSKRGFEAEAGPYILRSYAKDLSLSAEKSPDTKVTITCVEIHENNLYIGTSAGEILHLVRLPPEPGDDNATFIQASRFEPPSQTATENGEQPGVQQILLLPSVGKACILNNGVATFFTLPELSPFSRAKIRHCNWIGGLDADASDSNPNGEVMMALTRERTLMILVNDEVKSIKNLPYPGGLLVARRSAIACVSTTQSYDLLEVSQQVASRIPLFPISSLNAGSGVIGGKAQKLPEETSQRRNSTVAPRSPMPEDHGHSRSTSLGAFSGVFDRIQRPRGDMAPLERGDSVSPSPNRQPSPRPSTDKPLPAAPKSEDDEEPPTPVVFLKPHILTPTPTEFLLTTGTTSEDPGVGIFVNLEGDVSRGTIQFSRYPEDIICDDLSELNMPSQTDAPSGYVLAVIQQNNGNDALKALEIQKWGTEDAPEAPVLLKIADGPTPVGVRKVIETGEITLSEVKDMLRLVRIRVKSIESAGKDTPQSESSSDSRTRVSLEHVSREMELFDSGEEREDDILPKDWEKKKRKEEDDFAERLSKLSSRMIVWANNQVWWIIRNPLCVRLEAELHDALEKGLLNRDKLVTVINSIRGHEAQTELEFVSLSYVRQKAGLMMLTRLIQDVASGTEISEEGMRATEKILMESNLDPRVYLLHIPELRQDIFEGKTGIWAPQGVQEALSDSLEALKALIRSQNTVLNDEMLYITKQYLFSWRKRKGFGSIADEKEVFLSTDAALLRTMLLLDARNHELDPDMKQKSTVLTRRELESLVDNGFDCFDAAVTMLEDAKRLFALSRLYHSRKMSAQVLKTWKRMMEGEKDSAGDVVDGDKVRNFLKSRKDPSLVEEYGSWLASIDPILGVQVFADEESRVKFEPAQVVKILRQRAPKAVKYFLEYLVFSQKNFEYAGDLVNYYLDSVLSAVESSKDVRDELRATYDRYRAIRKSKPTYRQFISSQLSSDEKGWQASRLRLLELLGGSQEDKVLYDVPTVLSRMEPYEAELVPEMIILDSKQGRHTRALRLLVHGLADYDTALKYCLTAGQDIFHSSTKFDTQRISRKEQGELFTILLGELLQIQDVHTRIEQTGALLERYGGWLDAIHVLSIVPDTWSVDLLSSFLINTLRRLKRESNESRIAKALSGAENVKTTVELLDRRDEVGRFIVDEK